MHGFAGLAVAIIVASRCAWAGEKPMGAPPGPMPQFDVCHTPMPIGGRLGFAPHFTFYVSAIMPRGPINDSDITQAFAKFLEERYHVSGGECYPAQTREAAQSVLDDSKSAVLAAIPSALIVETGWTYAPPKAIEPAPPPKAVATTPQVPQPATVATTPKPNPPAASAAPKGVFVVCNGVDLIAGRLFFNPPLEVTSGDATAWSASYAKYLLTNYKYDRNIACTKLPTLAEAQSYYKETTDARRSTTDLNGKLVPLIVTNWTYP